MSPDVGSIASANQVVPGRTTGVIAEEQATQRHALLEDLRVLTRSQLSQAQDATGDVVSDLERVGEGIQDTLHDLRSRIGKERDLSCQIEGSSRDVLELAATGTEEALRTLFDARIKIDALEHQINELCDQNSDLQQSNRELEQNLSQEQANSQSLKLRQEQLRRQHQEKIIRLQECISQQESALEEQVDKLQLTAEALENSKNVEIDFRNQLSDRDSHIESLQQEIATQGQTISDLEEEIVQTRRETAQAIESFMNLEESLKTGAKAKAHLRILYEKSREGNEKAGTA